MTTRRISADLNSQLIVQIRSRRPMLYADGADATLDRPHHVRAASGLVWLDDRLAVIQDDASFIALVDPATGSARGLPLPAGPGGARVFEERRGTKKLKLDLEACVVAELAGKPHLVAFGSGSSARRERIAFVPVEAVHAAGEPTIRVVEAGELYAALRAAPALGGAELNLEGAVVRGDTLLLFQRGNGAAPAGQLAVNAVYSLSWPHVATFLDGAAQRGAQHGAQDAAPLATEVTVVELPELAGVRLTFTDATLAHAGVVLFLASAEASPNAVDDGVVQGSSLGFLTESGRVQLGQLLDESGAPCRDKVEGLVLDRRAPRGVLLTVDADDPDRPSELLEAELVGPWEGGGV